MASLEEGIFALLNNSAALKGSNLFPDASGTNCRLYPGTIAEEATLPAAAFARAGGSRQLVLGSPENLNRARFQFTVASDQYDDCVTIMDLFLNLLHGFAGALPNGVVVQLAKAVIDPIDEYSMEARLYSRHCDIEFIYNAA
jgi:hypothetical protein